MGDHSKIEWTDATWPVVQGCDPVSPGCVNCYAVPLLHRLAWNPNPTVSAPLKGLVEWYEPRHGDGHLRFTGKLALREDRLDWPLKWKRPRMIFVPSHGDIFHKDVPDSFLDKIFDVMEGGESDWNGREWIKRPWHTFQVLTKRSKRMCDYMIARYAKKKEYADKFKNCPTPEMRDSPAARDARARAEPSYWSNIWLGVSCERQEEADERIPHLLQTPAAVRFISAEPLLGAIDLGAVVRRALFDGALYPDGKTHPLQWVIVGGESGSHARPFDIDWARSLLQQCRASGVRAFMKQLGSNPYSDGRPMHSTPKGKYGDPSEWPPELRIREFPKTVAHEVAA